MTTQQRIRWGAVAGLAIAAVAPVVSVTDWSWLPASVSSYWIPSLNYFAFFPWAAFIAFGVSAGSILKLITADQINRLMQWSALAGFALILSGHYFSNLPYSFYAKSDFWLDSPGLVIIKLGVLLVMIAFSYLWTEYVVRDKWSWVKQLGTTSLLVYWVHIEIVYGRWFGSYKDALDSTQVAIFSVLLILAMLGLSVLRTKQWNLRFPAWVPMPATLAPRRVSGD
jgi:fucose 4-O-acetylase-like acetyltransferase